MADTRSQSCYQESKLVRIAFGIAGELLADHFCLFLIKCHYIIILKKSTKNPKVHIEEKYSEMLIPEKSHKYLSC